MKRLGTALVALLALVAFAGAAGTFHAVDGPTISDSETPEGETQITDVPPPTGGPPAGADESDARSAPTETPVSASDSGGVSPLFVPAFLGSLLASGLFVVFLTGDDERAPEAPMDDDSGNEGPTPSVDPEYDSPAHAVARAWGRLRERAGASETETPREVAARSRESRLPTGPVRTITRRFRTVRYGSDRPTEDQVADATAAAESLDGADDDSTASGDADSGGTRGR